MIEMKEINLSDNELLIVIEKIIEILFIFEEFLSLGNFLN